MKFYLQSFTGIFSALFIFSSCEKDPMIKHEKVNEEYVLTRDVNELQQKDDPISNHAKAIINGEIDAQYINSGPIGLDIDQDENPDINFEIINLVELNGSDYPDTLVELAIKATPIGISLLDNSTYGYADALSRGIEINEEGNWTDDYVMLATIASGGQFRGESNKYLAFKMPNDNGASYGWVEISCSQSNDTLSISGFAYESVKNQPIEAGQTN